MEIRIKTTMRYARHPPEWLKLQSLTEPSIGKDMERLEIS